MTKVATRAAVEEETERFRQYVIAAQTTATVGPQAERSLEKLNGLYHQDPQQFSPEDIRWLNVLRGYLARRLAAHEPAGEHNRRPKRRGDTLDHCWRCETPVDERFTTICPDCDSA